MNNREFHKYIDEVYNTEPDFPWESNPAFAVYRHRSNKKWFALVMEIPKSKLGLREDGKIDIVNLKCEPSLIGSLRLEKGFFPAYHMSKEKWISVALDGSVDDEQLIFLLDMSFELTDINIKNGRDKNLHY
ncbi:MAG: MmcQ/YjbR family DNA-binding protein [Ruminococcus sp.]|nr:MmcQ/YjbR family DNA-binding protein [Ruminococcus sp.]